MTTAELKMQRMALAGMLTERHYMERKWWSKLWRAMPHIDDSKRMDTARAVESAAKPSARGLASDRRCSPRTATGEHTFSTTSAWNR